ncbi:MAG: patatin family protein [Erysipelotrichaceae bacterium]|nr:patatin family protein [Erysipelotrichaceae bacterium]
MGKVALVLEGGGMRGSYTAGVIDCFIKHDILVDNCYGVSAGAINACSYISRQYGRSFAILTHNPEKKMGSLRKLFSTGNYLDNDFLYDVLPNEVYPLDKKTFDESKTNLFVVLTNVETGKAEYPKINNLDEQNIYVRASASLPIVSRFVPINNNWYLDGGMADSIPVKKAFDDGNEKCIVVLTRQKGYVKKKSSSIGIVKIKYRHYPKLVEAIKERHNIYNETLSYIENKVEEGKCLVIQPKTPVNVGRLEKDINKIKKLYEDGFNDALEMVDEIKKFIKKKR